MSLIDQFETILARKTCQQPFDKSKKLSKNQENTILCFNKLSQSIYNESFANKMKQSQDKNNVEKYKELRQKINTRVVSKPKKLTRKSPTKKVFELQQHTQNTLQINRNQLFCSKSVFYNNQRTQQLTLKKTIKQNDKQQTIKNHSKLSFYKPHQRRFSQQIPYVEDVFVGKHLQFKSHCKKQSQYVFSLIGSPEKIQKQQVINYRIKYSPRKSYPSKPSTNQSSKSSKSVKQIKQQIKEIKQTKCSQNELKVLKIDAWNSNILNTQQEQF